MVANTTIFVQLNNIRSKSPTDTATRELAGREVEEGVSQTASRSTSAFRRGVFCCCSTPSTRCPTGTKAHTFELISHWRDFTRDVAQNGNRIVYSCRSLDYSAPLSNKDLHVPQVNIQPMTDEQIQEFLRAYLPEAHQEVWDTVKGYSAA
jgi:hypothetical protein